MYAYDRNLRIGVSLDMDIRKAADGDIVVIHDERTGRTCDKDWVVAEKAVAELKTLYAAYHYDPHGDRSLPLRGRGLTIPTPAYRGPPEFVDSMRFFCRLSLSLRKLWGR